MASTDLSRTLGLNVGHIVTVAGRGPESTYPDPDATGALMEIGPGGRPLFKKNWIRDFTAIKVVHIAGACGTGTAIKRGAATTSSPHKAAAQKPFGDVHAAAKDGEMSVIRALLDSNPKLVSSRDSHGYTPLLLAAANDRKEIVEFLLDRKADIDAKGEDGRTPLYYASLFGHKDVVALLLASHADVRAADNNGETPLRVAMNGGYSDVVELLCQHDGCLAREGIISKSGFMLDERHQWNQFFVELLEFPGLRFVCRSDDAIKWGAAQNLRVAAFGDVLVGVKVRLMTQQQTIVGFQKLP